MRSRISIGPQIGIDAERLDGGLQEPGPLRHGWAILPPNRDRASPSRAPAAPRAGSEGPSDADERRHASRPGRAAAPPGDAGGDRQGEVVAEHQVARELQACRRDDPPLRWVPAPGPARIEKDRPVDRADEQGQEAMAALGARQRDPIVEVGEREVPSRERSVREPAHQAQRGGAEVRSELIRAGASELEQPGDPPVTGGRGGAGSHGQDRVAAPRRDVPTDLGRDRCSIAGRSERLRYLLDGHERSQASLGTDRIPVLVRVAEGPGELQRRSMSDGSPVVRTGRALVAERRPPGPGRSEPGGRARASPP